MDGRWVFRILIAVAVIGGIFYMKMQRRSDDSKQIHSEIQVVVVSLPEYPSNRKLIDAWCDLAHTRAFGAAYKVGGRRQSNKFDEEVYLDQFFKSLIDSARDFGKPELSKSMLKLQEEFNAARKASN